MGGEIIVVKEVRHTKLISDFSINLVVFSTATQFKAHVVAVGTVFYFIAPILDFPLRTDGIGEVRSYEGKNGDMFVSLEAVFDDQGNFEVVVGNIDVSFLGTALGVINTGLEEHGCGTRETESDDTGKSYAELGTYRDVTIERSYGTTETYTIIQALLIKFETTARELSEGWCCHQSSND